MADVNVDTDNDVGQSYLVSEIAIRQTNLKIGKVKILLDTTNTKKKTKAQKKDRMFVLSLHPAQSISHFTVYMHREGGLFATLNWTRSPEAIIEKHVNIAEHVLQGEIDSDDAKIRTHKYGSARIDIKLATDDLLPTTQKIPRFRILVIGNSGVGKSSLINEVFGLSGTDEGAAMVSHLHAGEADIGREITPADNSQLILHDSRGFEAGERGNLETVVKFIKSRNAMETLQDKLHAVWLCLRIPVAGGPLADAGIEKLLAMRESGEFGDLPFIVVYTQYDKLVTQVKYELRSQDEVKVTERVETLFKGSCLTPLEGKAKIPYTRVSTKADYKDTIAKLVKVTLDNISKDSSTDSYHALAIAQRVIPWLKIQTSIDVGRTKYWRSIFMGTAFRGHSLEECLSVLHTDVIAVWNLSDDYRHLRSREFQVLLYDMMQDVIQAASSGSPSQGEALTTNLRMAGTAATVVSGIAGGAAAAPIVIPIAVTVALLQWVHKLYIDSHDVLKRFMAYVIDLILVMQNVFLIVQAQNIPRSIDVWMINWAVRTYRTSRPKAQIHFDIVDFVNKGGIAGHNRSNAVDRIAAFIEQYRKESAELMKQMMKEEDPSKDQGLQTWGIELPKTQLVETR